MTSSRPPKAQQRTCVVGREGEGEMNWENSINTYTYIYILLLLLLSRFSCVRLCATPQTAAHQAPPSLGFSRQEHWSGLPFPSPMHESEKWRWSRLVVSCVWLFATPWTAAYQAPLSMGYTTMCKTKAGRKLLHSIEISARCSVMT